MLASDEDGDALDALRFSLASEIIELVVLTADASFLKTLREAVGAARRLWHVASADKVSDLLVAGGVGILVLDVQALHETSGLFVREIKRQFPDLVIVAAGHRDDETALAGLISSGMIYRFIHKPMSPARAKLFAEAAIKKYEGQRRRAAESSPRGAETGLGRTGLAVAATLVLGVIGALAWTLHENASPEGAPPRPGTAAKPSAAQLLLTRAAAALAANRLTDPKGDNALELYLAAQTEDPANPGARAGVSEVHERLLARAENALLEERLDEAAAAIETARVSGVESGRIAFLTAQLAKSRERAKAAQAQIQAGARARAQPNPADKMTPLLSLAADRMNDGHLLEPERDNARFYVEEALRIDPNNTAALDAKRTLAARLLGDVRSAVDRRDFARAASLIAGLDGAADAQDIESARSSLASARRLAETDAWSELLKNANQRLLQDRLIEPVNDSAKYYFLTLRQLDPGNAALGPLLQDLGLRLMAKARRALVLGQSDAAKSWLDEAAAIGFSSDDAAAVQRDLEEAVAKQNFLTTLIPANQLTLLKSVQPAYPAKAIAAKMDGWVDVEFTITANGKVADVSVRSASVPVVFDEAAVKAVSQWRYRPFVRDSKPVPVRTQIRIRFALS